MQRRPIRGETVLYFEDKLGEYVALVTKVFPGDVVALTVFPHDRPLYQVRQASRSNDERIGIPGSWRFSLDGVLDAR